jgi:uncharacterized repeat protein (TIGR01451 family)
MTASPDPVTAGSNLTYNVTVTNNGPNAATQVRVTDTLPASLMLVSTLPSQGTCTNGSTINCNLGTMENGTSATLAIVVKPTASGQISNTVSVMALQQDPDLNNNSATRVVQAMAPDLQITAASAPAEIWTDNAFTLSWTDKNDGNLAAQLPLTDAVFLSADNQLGGDISLGNFPLGQAISPGQSIERIQSIGVPRSAVPTDGQYFILIATDFNNNVSEGNGHCPKLS